MCPFRAHEYVRVYIILGIISWYSRQESEVEIILLTHSEILDTYLEEMEKK